jgi:hypothetical protein
MSTDWIQQLEHPAEDFFQAFAQRVRTGAEDTAREAVERLVPLVDWAAYLPHMPHGLLGLWAVFQLRPLLQETSFLRLLATQLHAFAHEGRGRKFRTLAQGSGHWGNLSMAITDQHPSIAWGEAMAIALPERQDFLRVAQLIAGDMACVGHKAVMAHRLAALHERLGGEASAGRRLLGITAWLAASEPSDHFWWQRIQQRLGPESPILRSSVRDSGVHESFAHAVCETGLVALMDHFAALVREGIGSGDLLASLVLAAAWKQLDARRDLEGKTAWNFVYLAAIAEHEEDPHIWGQAAALINLFPSEEEVSRLLPAEPPKAAGDLAFALQESILDGEAPQAMYLASRLMELDQGEELPKLLAEAAAMNDPVFNHSHHILAVASALELLPRIPAGIRGILLLSLVKLLANSQGSCDLGRRAEIEIQRDRA